MDNRDRSVLLDEFLDRAGWGPAERTPLGGDASFRHYIRLSHQQRTAMVMDAPPAHEDVRPFVKIANHLRQLGFSAPEILAEDEDNGFLLLEDFGDTTFTHLLTEGEDERSLYQLGLDVLIALHAINPAEAAPDWLPPYDDRALRNEADLLVDWFMPAQDLRVTTETRAEYERLWMDLFAFVHEGPRTLVLRDYHVDNLMRLPKRDHISACGLLDFQDAVAGHPAYDLMSLLEDARRDVEPTLQAELKEAYRDALNLDDAAWSDFETAYAILGAQRHAKVIGIFTRLHRRDGKAVYLKHIGRVWRLLENALKHPALADMQDWMDANIPYAKRTAPPEDIS